MADIVVKRPQRIAKRNTAARGIQSVVEAVIQVAVLLNIAAFCIKALQRDDFSQTYFFFFCDAFRSPFGCKPFDQHPDCINILDVFFADADDDGAFVVFDLNKAFLFQLEERLPHRRPADAERFAKPVFRQALPGLIRSVQNILLDPMKNTRCQRSGIRVAVCGCKHIYPPLPVNFRSIQVHTAQSMPAFLHRK